MFAFFALCILLGLAMLHTSGVDLLAMGWGLGPVLIGVAVFVWVYRRNLAKHGVACQAEILEMNPIFGGANNRVSFRLRVHPRAGAPYQVEHTDVVHVLHAHLLRVGIRVDVLVDPKNPKHLRIIKMDELPRLSGQQHPALEQKPKA
jgi:hypothetical protein